MRNLRAGALIFCFLLAVPAGGFSSEAHRGLLKKFYKAEGFYKDSDYNGAIKAYEGILSGGKTNGAVYYNLGNSYFKDGQLGKAILNYERAKLFLPRDSDLNANYQYAFSLVKNYVEDVERPFVTRIMSGYVDNFSMNEIMGIILLFYALLLAGCLLSLILKWTGKRRAVILAVVGVFLIFNIFIFTSKISGQKNTAIMLGKVEAKFEPIEDSTVHFRLSEGMKVVIVEAKGLWLKIKRSDGKTGWVPLKILEII